MSFSKKNKLQEYFQKRNLPLPCYTTVFVGKDLVNPKWRSYVVTHDDKKCFGDVYKTKAETENSAAEKMLTKLQNDDTPLKNYRILKKEREINNLPADISTEISIDVKNLQIHEMQDKKNEKIILIVDVENISTIMQKLLPIVSHLLSEQFLVYLFYSKNCSLIDKLKIIDKDFIHTRQIPSTRPDASDTAIIFFVGHQYFISDNTTFIILTRDHFASSLEDCVAKGTEWLYPSSQSIVQHKNKILHMTTIDEFLSYVKN
jgi:hypothetical protein